MTQRNKIESCGSCIHGWKNFRHLSKDELHYVNQNRYEAAFKSGETIIKQGSPSSNVLFLSSGLAKVYMEGINGKCLIMSIAKPGRMIIGPGAYVNSRHTYTVSALSAVQACFISFEVFRHLLRTNGAFAESLVEDISTKSLRTHTRMINLAQKKMPGRLAETILYLADEIFSSDEFDMILSRQEIGEMSNMAKECVVRIIKEFEGSGIIISHGSRMKITDKKKLNLISERG
jgi:CRP/FNR family transcriptional regulator